MQNCKRVYSRLQARFGLRGHFCDLVLTRPSVLSNVPLEDEAFNLHCYVVAFATANHTALSGRIHYGLTWRWCSAVKFGTRGQSFPQSRAFKYEFSPTSSPFCRSRGDELSNAWSLIRSVSAPSVADISTAILIAPLGVAMRMRLSLKVSDQMPASNRSLSNAAHSVGCECGLLRWLIITYITPNCLGSA